MLTNSWKLIYLTRVTFLTSIVYCIYNRSVDIRKYNKQYTIVSLFYNLYHSCIFVTEESCMNNFWIIHFRSRIDYSHIYFPIIIVIFMSVFDYKLSLSKTLDVPFDLKWIRYRNYLKELQHRQYQQVEVHSIVVLSCYHRPCHRTHHHRSMRLWSSARLGWTTERCNPETTIEATNRISGPRAGGKKILGTVVENEIKNGDSVLAIKMTVFVPQISSITEDIRACVHNRSLVPSWYQHRHHRRFSVWHH